MMLCAATRASAQRGRDDASEFTRQGLLIVNFTPSGGADLKLGRTAADVVRSRLDKMVNKREVYLVDADQMRYELTRDGFNPDTTFPRPVIHLIGRYLRADEYVQGHVSDEKTGSRLSGELVLLRDSLLRQPLPDAAAPTLDSAATLFAKAIVAARAQLIPERRCENALHMMRTERAIEAARAGIASYPRSTIARSCLLLALRQAGAPAAEIIPVARQVLTIDSMSAYALEAAAVAYDSLKQRDDAAAMWLRLARTDSANVELALRVSYALFVGGNAERAEPLIMHEAAMYPNDLRILRQVWIITFANKSWTHAAAAGEKLLASDSVAQRDSAFYLHLATAYYSAGQPYHAIETLARGVITFPTDARLYSLYAQYIQAEADTVIPRGLALFPRSAELLALHAKRLRARDDTAASLDAMKRAVALDSTIAHAVLTVAQLEFELGRPDSALAALHRALASGEDSALVAQFALAKGNTLYQTASGTKTSGDFTLALRFLAFADTVHSSPQSKFLVGAAALGVAQSALIEATKLTDKPQSCRLAQLGADMVPLARTALQAGQEAFGEEAARSLEYLAQLDPYVGRETSAFCQ